MYIESWTTTTFDGETFQQMTTSGTEYLDASIGLTTEARTPWFLLNSIKTYELQSTQDQPTGSQRPTDGMIYPRT